VRGSPLLRFILLALALAAAAAGLARVTSPRGDASASDRPNTVVEKAVIAKNAIPFRLLLSDAASEIVIDAASELRPAPGGGTVSGSVELDPANPSLGLIVRWKNPPASGEHRFAKLTLEAPGQPTFTHVFDADGDIDDFMELPFSATK
jgi:hypothetical protein